MNIINYIYFLKSKFVIKMIIDLNIKIFDIKIALILQDITILLQIIILRFENKYFKSIIFMIYLVFI